MNRTIPKITLVLLGVMAAIAIVLFSLPPSANQMAVIYFGCSLFYEGQFLPERLYTTVTAVFLHGSWFHLLANGIWLLILSPMAFGQLGNARFLVLFLLSGIAGNVAHSVLYSEGFPLVIGASGAVFGLLGAGGYVLTRGPGGTPPTRSTIVHYAIVMMLLMGGYALLDVGGGVSWSAHAGGFVAGLIVYPFLRVKRPRNGPLRPV